MIHPLPAPKLRCESKHPVRGVQCGLPLDHVGQHANGTICAPWENPAPHLLILGLPAIEKLHAHFVFQQYENSADLEQAYNKYRDASPTLSVTPEQFAGIIEKAKTEMAARAVATVNKLYENMGG
jgi:hypothetical protein